MVLNLIKIGNVEIRLVLGMVIVLRLGILCLIYWVWGFWDISFLIAFFLDV